MPNSSLDGNTITQEADRLRLSLPRGFRDGLVESIFKEAGEIARRNTQRKGESKRMRAQRRLDDLLTNKWTGLPIMALIFAFILWLTIQGANYPSGLLATLLLEIVHPWLKGVSASMGVPYWIDGLLLDGVYLTSAWVVSVMLPPMAIFFPAFTMLEDFGYLPRVAFNMDRLFQAAGAHGKQALTMSMGFGCNAAGVIATRIIDSPRERILAIITNNFSLCNGRWPTQILIATIFIGALAPSAFGGLTATFAVFAVATFGIFLTFVTSWALSRTVLKGEASAFSLELPPYRPPRIWRTLYTSLIDRTLFVLWRAVVFAVPAGIVIWAGSNIMIGDQSFAQVCIDYLDPFAVVFGLTGVILVAYVVAIPANEIVIPTILMLTVLTTGISISGSSGAGVMFETDDTGALSTLLRAGGWTTLTAVNLMLFSLCHNPCSTTIYTIYKETKSIKWTAWATLMPLAIGFGLCAAVAFVWRSVAG